MLNGLPWWLSDKDLSASTGEWVWSLGQEGPLEKEMATHSSNRFLGILWIKSLAGLQKTLWGCKGVRHDWVTKQKHQIMLNRWDISEVKCRFLA